MARRLTKAEQQALAKEQLWADAWSLSEQLQQEREAQRLADEEEAARRAAENPFYNVIGGSRTYEQVPDQSMSAGMYTSPRESQQRAGPVSDAVLSGTSRAANILGTGVDLLSPDPNALAEDPTNLLQNAWENVVDTAVALPGALANVARGVGEWAGMDVNTSSSQPDPFARLADATNAVRGAREAERVQAQPAGGVPERAGFTNELADTLYGTSSALREGMSPESRAAGQAMGAAIDQGAGATLRELASVRGITSLLTDTLPGSLPDMALGFGTGRALSTVGVAPATAAKTAGGVVGFNIAQTTANEVEKSVLAMSPATAASNPEIVALLQQGMTLDQAKAQVARQARYSALSVGLAAAPAYAAPGNLFERMGAGASHKNRVLQTLGRRAAGETVGEVVTEAGQGALEKLAQNVGEVDAGLRDRSAILDGLAGSAILEGVAGGPVAAVASASAAQTDFSNRADRLNRVASALDQFEARQAARRDALVQDQFETEQAEADAARTAQADFLSQPTVERDAPARPTESFEAYAAREGAEVTAAEDAQRAFAGMPAGQEPVRTLDRELPGTRAQRRADAERTAGAVVAEQQTQDAFEVELAAEEAAANEARVAQEQGTIEATQLDEKTRQNDLKTARTKHAADRRATLTAVQRENSSLPDDQRVEAIRQAAVEWDAANPPPVLGQAPVSSGRRATPARQAPAPAVDTAVLEAAGMTPEEVATEVAAQGAPQPTTLADREAALRQSLGRAETASESATERSAGDVVRAIATRVGKGSDSRALAQEQLLLNGKLRVVDSATMAEVSGLENADGFYDGENMYVNAGYVPEGQEVGGVLNTILAHESDHAARLSGNADAASKVSILLGPEAKDRLITQLETATHPIAQQARDMLEARGITREADAALYEDEATAYAITAAMQQGNQGGVWAPIRGLVSAARRKFKEFTGSEDINLDDLGAYAQQTIDALALSEDGITADTDGRAMIVGPTATGWDELPNRFQGRVDGMDRSEISDYAAEINTNKEDLDDFYKGEVFKLDELFNHETLYEQYPQLRNINAKAVNFSSRTQEGLFDGRNIEVSRSLVDLARAGETEPLRRIILHEAQHAVQQIEGFVGGTNPRALIPNSIRQAYDLSVQRFEGMVENFSTEAAINTLPTDVREQWDDLIKDVSSKDKRWRAIAFLNNDFGDTSNNQLIRSAQSRYRDVKNRLRSDREAYMAADKQAFATYERDYGEAEARNTENRSRMSPDDITIPDLTPENTRGVYDDVTADQTVNTVPLVRAAARASTAGPAVTTPPPTVPYVRTKTEATTSVLKDLLTVYGAVGKDSYNLSQDAENARNAIYQTAVSHNARVDAGLSRAAKRVGKDKSVLNAEILKRIEAISKIDNSAKKSDLISRIAVDYPELQGLVSAIQDISALTSSIIGARLSDPTPLTEEEMDRLEYMNKNKLSYMTNLYAAFQGSAGKEYKDRLLLHYQQGVKALSKGKAVPDNIKREYDIYSRALKFVAANDVAVSDPEHLAALPMDQLEGLYSMWAPRGESASNLRTRMTNEGGFDKDIYRDFMSDEIAGWVNAASTEEITNHANATINALLNNQPLSGPAKRYGKGGGIDDTILQHRKEVPPELQELYGKVRDIPALINATIVRQGELASRLHYYNKVVTEGYGRDVVSQSDSAKPEFARFTVPISGESYGPANGMYATPEFAQRLDVYNEASVTLADTAALVGTNPMIARDLAGKTGFKWWTRAAGLQKAAKIITRPDYLVLNALGSVAAPILTGGVHPQNLSRGLKVAAEHLEHTINPSKDQDISVDLRMALAMGLFDSAVTQEIRTAPRKLVQQLIKEMTHADDLSKMDAAMDKVSELGGTAWRTLVEAYSLSDAWVKMPVAFERMDYLTKYYEANGDTVTNEQIIREAADFTRNSTISMQNTAGGVKFAERLGMTFYAPYFYSAFRTLAYAPKNILNSAQMAADAKTPKARNIAEVDMFKKIAGFGTTMTLLTEGLKYAAEALMDDDEEEQLERDRALMFESDAAGDLMYLGTDDSGRRQYVNVSRVDPYGPATDVLRQMNHAGTPAEKLEAAATAIKDLVLMNRGFGFIVNTLSGKDKSTQLERVFSETSSTMKEQANNFPGGYEAMNVMLEAADLFSPAGPMNWADPNNKTPEEVDGNGRAFIAGMSAVLGHKLVSVDESQSLGMAARELQDHRKDARAKIRDVIAANGPEAGLQQLVIEAKRERDLVADLGSRYEAIKEGKTGRSKTEEMLKDSRIDARTIANLRKQAYTTEADEWVRKYSDILSESSINNVPKFFDVMSDEERKERQKEWKRQAKEVRRRVRILNEGDEG